MKTIVLLVLVAAAGCSKKPPDCDASIARGIANFSAGLEDLGPTEQLQRHMTSALAKLKTLLSQRCVADRWAPEVVSCFAAVTTMKDLQDCQARLPEPLRAEIRELLFGSPQRMPDAVPGHPPALSGSSGSGAEPAGQAGSAAPAPGAEPAGSTTPPGPATPSPAPAAPAAGSSTR